MATDPQLAELRRQAESLATVLRTEVPKHARTLQPLQLEPGAPGGIAALWESVGFSEALTKRALISPQLDASEARIAERIADYTSWGEGFSLTAAALPARRRLAQDDGQGVAFFVTDETGGGLDAPMLGVFADDNKVKQVADSYVRWCANELVNCAFSRWYETEVLMTPADALTKLGSAPWPLLTKAALELTADVFAVPPRDSNSKSAHKKGRYRLAHRSVEALVVFLKSLQVESIEVGPLAGDDVRCPQPIESLLREGDAIRWLPSPTQARFGVGRLADQQLFVVANSDNTALYVSPRHTDELRAALAARAGA